DLTQPVFCGEDLLGINTNSNALAKLGRDGAMLPLLLASNVSALVDSLPAGALWRTYRLEASDAFNRSVARLKHHDEPWVRKMAAEQAMQAPIELEFRHLKPGRLIGEKIWGLQIEVKRPFVTDHNSLLLFFSIENWSVRPKGYAWLPSREVSHFELFDGP